MLSGLPARAQAQPAQNDAAAQAAGPDQQNSADPNNPAQANSNQNPNNDQNQPDNQNQNNDPNAAPAAGAQPAAPPAAPVPGTLDVPAGTVIAVRVQGWLSTDHNKVGDPFTATLDQPIVETDGYVVARRGQTVYGTVTLSDKGGRIHGVSQLGLALGQLTLVDGQQVSRCRRLTADSQAGTSNGRDAAAVGTTTGTGAVIGAVADGGGAGARKSGAAARAASRDCSGVLTTRGRPTVIPPESLVDLPVAGASLAINTEKSQVAFQPVTQQDFNNNNRAVQRRPRPLARPGYYAARTPATGLTTIPTTDTDMDRRSIPDRISTVGSDSTVQGFTAGGAARL